jgi:hypothetical protein
VGGLVQVVGAVGGKPAVDVSVGTAERVMAGDLGKQQANQHADEQDRDRRAEQEQPGRDPVAQPSPAPRQRRLPLATL